MKELKLENSNKKAIVDNDNYIKLKIYKWALSPDGYPRATINKERLYLHRYVMRNKLKSKKYVCDHIDRNKLNNCRSNLRIVTNRENVVNSPGKNIKKYSKFKGVSYCSTEKRRKRWVAASETNNKNIYLGRYYTELEAARAYNEGVKKIFGKTAYLNPIGDCS